MEGALAQHAEATLERIGAARERIVRELFRNLTTAQGTRAVLDRAELLSAFPDRAAAEEVLQRLIDARLVTTYETEGAEGQPSEHRVEIVHESLLTAWPRLVRWQTQEADGAQLRDQLRQAAHLWEERGRREDLLWTGASYLDYRAWRGRYAGGLSSLEEDFAGAMAALTNRNRRRRRIAVAAVIAALAIGLGIVAAFWGRSETARRKADAQTLRAEASKLLALGQLELERYPTGALAYALKSLELSDAPDARQFALRVLQKAPTASWAKVDTDRQFADSLAFSPNGEWLAVGDARRAQLRPRSGGPPIPVQAEYPDGNLSLVHLGFLRDGDLLVTRKSRDLRVWSVPGGRETRRMKVDEGSWAYCLGAEGLFTATRVGKRDDFRWWPLGEGESRLIGSTTTEFGCVDVDRAGTRLAYALGRGVYLRSLENWALPPQLVGEHAATVELVEFDPDGKHLVSRDESGEILIWPTTGGSRKPLRLVETPESAGIFLVPGGKWLLSSGGVNLGARLWDRTAPPFARPLVLAAPVLGLSQATFEPGEKWVVTSHVTVLAFWPLERPTPGFSSRTRPFSTSGSRPMERPSSPTLETASFAPGRSPRRAPGSLGSSRPSRRHTLRWRSILGESMSPRSTDPES